MFRLFKRKSKSDQVFKLFSHGRDDKTYDPCPACLKTIEELGLLDMVLRYAQEKIRELEDSNRIWREMLKSYEQEIDDLKKQGITIKVIEGD